MGSGVNAGSWEVNSFINFHTILIIKLTNRSAHLGYPLRHLAQALGFRVSEGGAPYNTTSGRDCVKSLRLCLHGTCPQRSRVPGVGWHLVLEVLEVELVRLGRALGQVLEVVDVPLGVPSNLM